MKKHAKSGIDYTENKADRVNYNHDADLGDRANSPDINKDSCKDSDSAQSLRVSTESQATKKLVNDKSTATPDKPAPSDANQESSEVAIKEKENKTKKKNNKVVSVVLDILIVVLLAAGIYLILKPIVARHRQDDVMSDLLNIFDQNQDTTRFDNDSTAPSFDARGMWVDSNANAIEGEAMEDFGQDIPTTTTAPRTYLEILGKIQIDSVDINLPLIKGAGYVPLRYGAGWYESSAPVGAPGRTTILGHTMFYDQRFFSRIPEIKVNDEIKIFTFDKVYTYVVSETKAIAQKSLPEYLTKDSENSTLMLVTCYNRPSWDQRYLVFADLKDVAER